MDRYQKGGYFVRPQNVGGFQEVLPLATNWPCLLRLFPFWDNIYVTFFAVSLVPHAALDIVVLHSFAEDS